MTSILARTKRYLHSREKSNEERWQDLARAVVGLKSYRASRNEGTRGSVLIAEPDATIARRILVALDRDRWNVDAAATGEEALNLARQSWPNVVVVGEGLEDMDWRELMGMLRLERPEMYTPMYLMWLPGNRKVIRDIKRQSADDRWLKKESAASAVGEIVALARDSNPLDLCFELTPIAPYLKAGWPVSRDPQGRVRELNALLEKVRSEKESAE